MDDEPTLGETLIDSVVAAKQEALVAGTKLGMDTAVDMARYGNLRLYALPFEVGERPYEGKLRPWAITVSAWRAWYRERFQRYGFRKIT